MFSRGGRIASSSRRALIILPLWIACVVWMWGWWLDADRVSFLGLFIPLTLALLYEFALLPSVFLYFVLKAKMPPKRIAPKGKKVAVISLCVPSKESIDIVEGQFKAMSSITYPHDSWILDEGNDPAIKALARKYGVKHFSRKGVEKYNQEGPPFKAKTKAGNINAWLEHVKRRKYDYFVQFDIDHHANPNYLNKVLGFFRDEGVAWVQSPSVYGNRSHWTSRGAAEQELVLQGPLQMGFFGHSQTPFIIGSHCTYRMSAIREIGGFQPTRAEDHLDTVVLSSKGYRGVFLPEIIAVGDGPDTLKTYLSQQFAWAYSMFQILMHHTPKLLRTIKFRRKWQFLFAQTWYPLWALSYCVMFFAPIVALLINRDVARMERVDFLLHFVPIFACSFLVWWAARPIMQPREVKLSWRGMILHAVRWPVILLAVLQAAFNIKKPYMITPKGTFSYMAPSLDVYRPFLLLGFISAFAVLYATNVNGNSAVEGQMVFALTNAMFMLIICFVDIDIRLRQAKTKVYRWSRDWFKPVAATTALAVVTSTAFVSAPFVTDQIAEAGNNLYQEAPYLSEPSIPIDQMTTEQLTASLSELPKSPSEKVPEFGIYHREKTPRANQPYIRHQFVDWNDDRMLARQVLKSHKEKNTPLITLEPRGETDGAVLLSDIAAGKYDQRLNEVNKILGASNKPVYVRFGHEMELANLYPWGNQDPQLFIAAYQHVVDYSKKQGADNVKWVWSPAGNVGSEAYYPGDEFVDVIGATVLHDKYFYGERRLTFQELSAQRLDQLQRYDKPLWVVEFGAGAADPAYQQALISEAATDYKQLGFSALIYLNIADSNIVGPDYRMPSLSSYSVLFAKPVKNVVPAPNPSDLRTEILTKKPSVPCSDQYDRSPYSVLRIKSDNTPLLLRKCKSFELSI